MVSPRRREPPYMSPVLDRYVKEVGILNSDAPVSAP